MTARFVHPLFDVGIGITPSSGAKLFFFEDDGVTPKNTHTTKAGVSGEPGNLNANPVVALSTGVFPDIYITGDYKITLKDKKDAQIGTGLLPINEFAAVTDAAFVKNFDTLAEAIADTGLVGGDTFKLTNDRGNSDWNVVLLSTVTVSVGAPAIGNIVASTGDITLAFVLDNDSPVNATHWGAIGDGVFNNDAVRDLIADFVSNKSGTAWWPLGDYRFTGGYTQTVAQNDILFLGEGTNRENLKTPQIGTTFTLDNIDVNSFFYKQQSRHYLQCERIIFRCAQFVQDRKFFIFDAGGAAHNFKNVNFESVEKPINYTANCAFQNAAFRDVQFRASGTFHSESTNIIGTLLLLDNVNHESTVPLNSDKVLCDLRGIREIKATNFLLEGSLAEAGWTIIKTDTTASTDWIQHTCFTVDTFHSEWSTNQPAFVLDQNAGYSVFSNSPLMVSDVVKIRLNNHANVILDGVTLGTTGIPEIREFFDFVDLQSTATLNNCAGRGTTEVISDRITINSYGRLSDTNAVSNTKISNNVGIPIVSFDGGFFDTDQVLVQPQNGTIFTPSTDATFGRKISLTRGTALTFFLSAINNENWNAGEQFVLVVRMKLPAFGTGLYALSPTVNFAFVDSINYTPADSGTIVEATMPFRALTSVTHIGLQIRDVSATDTVGDLEVYTLEIYRGSNIKNSFQTIYPKNVTTFNSVAPTLGSWKQGDKVYDTTPSASGFAGFICTASGTPGTWKTFGVISV
jgi:hypothetical protein